MIRVGSDLGVTKQTQMKVLKESKMSDTFASFKVSLEMLLRRLDTQSTEARRSLYCIAKQKWNSKTRLVERSAGTGRRCTSCRSKCARATRCSISMQALAPSATIVDKACAALFLCQALLSSKSKSKSNTCASNSSGVCVSMDLWSHLLNFPGTTTTIRLLKRGERVRTAT